MNAAAWMLIIGKVLIYLAVIVAILFVTVYAVAKAVERLLELADPWDDEIDEDDPTVEAVDSPFKLLCLRHIDETTYDVCYRSAGHEGSCSSVVRQN